MLYGDLLLSTLFFRCFSRNWSVTDYGVCEITDLLTEIPDTTITVAHQDMDTVISVPKRGPATAVIRHLPAEKFPSELNANVHSAADRTAEEIERTKQFGKEVVDLLRHQPHCRMPFNKFIPTYHHHFGRQCKLSYYGFTKLMELFEAIPDILTVSLGDGFVQEHFHIPLDWLCLKLTS